MDLDYSLHVSMDGGRWTDAFVTFTESDGQVIWVGDTERGPFDSPEDLWLWLVRSVWRHLSPQLR